MQRHEAPPQPSRPRTMRLRTVVQYTGLSLATVNRALHDGHLVRLKAGRTTLIETANVDSWIDSMKAA